MGDKIHVAAKQATTPAFKPEGTRRLQQRHPNPFQSETSSITDAERPHTLDQSSLTSSSLTPPPRGHSFGRIAVWPSISSSIQPKLAIGQTNGLYEQEADRVADQVMPMAEPRVQAKCACGGEAGPDGECAACKAQRLAIQRHTDGAIGEALSRSGQETENEIRIQRQPQQPPPSARPQDFVTYEDWLESMAHLPDFPSSDVPATAQAGGSHRVIGSAPALNAGTPDAERPTDPAERERLAPPPAQGVMPGEGFIDHPTDTWVRNNLDPELRNIAYLLPSDCADMAVILRHVWLFAHHRGENYGGWRIGTLAGRTESARMTTLRSEMTGQIYSGSVSRIVNQYRAADGHPIRSFEGLQPLLHEGDVLVWEHRDSGGRAGGHTSTLESITRNPNSGAITGLSSLQGNQPIGPTDALSIMRQQSGQDDLTVDKMTPQQTREWRRLRDLPGRRLERLNLLDRIGTNDVDLPVRGGRRGQTERVWQWSDGSTVLIAAGPPQAVRRPAPQRTQRGQTPTAPSALWLTPLHSANNRERLQAVFEAVLLDLRTTLERGDNVTEAEAIAIGTTTGETLWNLATRSARNRGSQDEGVETHFDPLHEFRAILRSMAADANPPHVANVQVAFQQIDQAFNLAARGGTGVRFGPRAQGQSRRRRTVNLLLTGFDPFGSAGIGGPTAPTQEEWNPSGAAALALDGWEQTIKRNLRVHVETVVLPVSFTQFSQGIVEQIVSQHQAEVDAIITVSMDSSIGLNEPVRIEEYAVGVHDVVPLQTHRLLMQESATARHEGIPAQQHGPEGAPLHQTAEPAALGRIASATERQPSRQQGAIPQPTLGTDITLRFADMATADAALQALGMPSQHQNQVVIRDPAAVERIRATLTRTTLGSANVAFEISGRRFSAALIRGPGGSFLSNEVSYRTLRQLETLPAVGRPMSYHVHTQGGRVQTDRQTGAEIMTYTPAQRHAIRANLIATLQRMILATAEEVTRTSP